LLIVLVQIANKVGLKKKSREARVEALETAASSARFIAVP
jgi:hypothetical protein